MLNFEEFDDKLVIKKTPSKLWIFIVLVFILIWTGTAFSFDGIVFGILGVVSFIFVLFSLLIATKDEIVIDKKNKELTINRKKNFSSNTDRQIYKFDALAETIEFEKRRVGKSEEYFAYVKTLDNKKVELFNSSTSNENQFFILFRLSNHYFIGLSNNNFQLPII